MAYEQYGKIEANDIDTGLIGPMDAAKRLNALWGRGFGSRGYGQSPILPDVNPGDPILASDWNGMKDLGYKIGQHTGFGVTTDNFFPGGRVLFNQGLTKKMIETLDSNRTSSFWQSGYSLTSLTNDYQFYNKLTYTITATFPTGDHARYYFNCGGQFAFRMYQPGINSSIPVRQQMAKLATDIGTIYWSIVPGGGAASRIANVNYTATTKIGGAGNASVDTGTDYYTPSIYSLTGAATTIFTQIVSNGVPGYDQSFVSLGVYTNGDKGSYGANGNVIVFKFIMDVAPNTAAIPNGGTAYCYVIPPLADPANSYLSQQSWAIPSINMTVLAT